MGKKIFIILIALWTLTSIAAIFLNAFKLRSEVKEWVFISDQEKRYKIFGDLYHFFIFINENTDNEKILIVSNDVRTFYLGAYYLYPKKVEVISEKEIDKFMHFENYKYVALFNIERKIKGFRIQKIEKSKRGNSFWTIYKNE